MRDLVDNDGDVVNHLVYDAWGNLVDVVDDQRDPTTLATRYTYAGRDIDPVTGLMYYRARWYDPAVGSFIGEDPLGLGPDSNPRRYVENSPTNFVDAWGLEGQGVGGRSLRSELFSDIDEWSHGTTTGWRAVDFTTAGFGSVAGNFLAKPAVWVFTNWREDTQCEREEAILVRQEVVNHGRDMGAWGAGLNLYAGATTDRIAYGLVGYDPIADRELTGSERWQNVGAGSAA